MLRGTGHDAEDVVQDALIRAYRGLRVTDRPMAPAPVAVHDRPQPRPRRAARAPQRTDVFDDEIGLCAVPDADPADRIAERDELRRLVAEIGRLPERQRMALVMREFDGRSHAETARALHTTVPATKSLIIRARSNLGAALVAA